MSIADDFKKNEQKQNKAENVCKCGKDDGGKRELKRRGCMRNCQGSSYSVNEKN